jgi:hypothetical protein
MFAVSVLSTFIGIVAVSFECELAAVCTENSNPNVVMVKPAEDGL